MPSIKGRTIVVTGRGGTGKSTFTVLMSRFLSELGWKPLLLIDSDPDESLSDMLGIDMKKEGKKTVSEMLYEIQETQTMSKMIGMTASDKIEPFLFQNTLYEGILRFHRSGHKVVRRLLLYTRSRFGNNHGEMGQEL